MARKTKELIKKLEQQLIGYQRELKVIGEQVLKLKDNNKQSIADKEKELEAWRNKLELCQQEKKQIEKEIEDKVKELENSQLSSTEKQAAINKLLTEHSEELDNLGQEIESERTDYRHLRDKLIEELSKPCSICPEKERAKGYLKRKITYLFGLLVIFVFLAFLFHIWFIRWSWKRKCCRRLRKVGGKEEVV